MFLEEFSSFGEIILQSYNILKSLTIDAARCIGMSETIGSLEVGKKADIVLFNAKKKRLVPENNPIDLIVRQGISGDFHTVIVNGKILIQNHQFLSPNTLTILEKAEEQQEKIVSELQLNIPLNPSKIWWQHAKMEVC